VNKMHTVSHSPATQSLISLALYSSSLSWPYDLRLSQLTYDHNFKKRPLLYLHTCLLSMSTLYSSVKYTRSGKPYQEMAENVGL